MKTEAPIAKKTKKNQTIRNSYTDYVKYSAIAFQMAAVIGLGVFGGQYLDKKLALQTPWFTLVLSLFSVVLAIYIAVKDFIHNK